MPSCPQCGNPVQLDDGCNERFGCITTNFECETCQLRWDTEGKDPYRTKPTKEYVSLGSVTGVLHLVGRVRRVVGDRGMNVLVGNPYQGTRLTWPSEGSRVAVNGLLTRNAEGLPVQIRPDQVDVLPSEGEAPPLTDLIGAWAKEEGNRHG